MQRNVYFHLKKFNAESGFLNFCYELTLFRTENDTNKENKAEGKNWTKCENIGYII
jgi:hypothetical protein